MANLRELLRRLHQCDTVTRRYEMFEALVEAVEPEDPHIRDATICKLRVERNDLRVERDGWEQGCAEAEQELAKAKAEIEKLRKERDSWHRRHGFVSAQLVDERAEGKRLRLTRDTWEQRCIEDDTEIERLRKERDERALLAVGSEVLLASCRESLGQVCAELTEAKAEIETLRGQRDEWAEKAVASAGASRLFVVPNQEFEADAEIGRLVRGMRSHTRIIKGGRCYWPEFLEDEVWQKCPPCFFPDPADALRNIQQKKPQE